MSDNLELIKGTYEAFSRGDIETVVDSMHPDIDWNEAEHTLWHKPGGYHGPADILANVFARIPEDFVDFNVVPRAFHDAGDTVIVEGRYRARAKATADPLDAQVCHVWTIQDGKTIGFQQYTDSWQFARVTRQQPE